MSSIEIRKLMNLMESISLRESDDSNKVEFNRTVKALGKELPAPFKSYFNVESVFHEFPGLSYSFEEEDDHEALGEDSLVKNMGEMGEFLTKLKSEVSDMMRTHAAFWGSTFKTASQAQSAYSDLKELEFSVDGEKYQIRFKTVGGQESAVPASIVVEGSLEALPETSKVDDVLMGAWEIIVDRMGILNLLTGVVLWKNEYVKLIPFNNSLTAEEAYDMGLVE